MRAGTRPAKLPTSLLHDVLLFFWNQFAVRFTSSNRHSSALSTERQVFACLPCGGNPTSLIGLAQPAPPEVALAPGLCYLSVAPVHSHRSDSYPKRRPRSPKPIIDAHPRPLSYLQPCHNQRTGVRQKSSSKRLSNHDPKQRSRSL